MNITRLFRSRFGKETAIVLVTLLTLVSLPLLVVVTAAASGTAAVSQALVKANPVTHVVEVFDSHGKKVAELELSTTWPTTGIVTDEFGTHDPFRRLLGLGKHTGIDIADEHSQTGNPVTPFMLGTVTRVDTSDNDSCGISVRLDHGNGISSLYCHLASIATTVGKEVKPGDVIGYTGNTGTSTGPHLHFQTMVYDIPVNPRTFMVGEPTRTHSDARAD